MPTSAPEMISPPWTVIQRSGLPCAVSISICCHRPRARVGLTVDPPHVRPRRDWLRRILGRDRCEILGLNSIDPLGRARLLDARKGEGEHRCQDGEGDCEAHTASCM